LPELRALDLHMRVISFPEPIDSSNVGPGDWQDLAYIIEENYEQYDGFVILHGTDTMAYTASALSFMLRNLQKPVIFTGAQIPIGSTRSDARENLITALEIASTLDQGKPVITEVCIYFNFVLLRANRSLKVSSNNFSAFHSENHPPLATSGTSIDYNNSTFIPVSNKPLQVLNTFDDHVVILKLFPGISQNTVQQILSTPGLRGVIMETYGSGNTTNVSWFIELLTDAIERGILIVNVSQCLGGRVNQGKYETSTALEKIGVISGYDMTTEAAVTKLMLLLGSEENSDDVKAKMQQSLCGEISNN